MLSLDAFGRWNILFFRGKTAVTSWQHVPVRYPPKSHRGDLLVDFWHFVGRLLGAVIRLAMQLLNWTRSCVGSSLFFAADGWRCTSQIFCRRPAATDGHSQILHKAKVCADGRQSRRSCSTILPAEGVVRPRSPWAQPMNEKVGMNQLKRPPAACRVT